MWSVSNEGKKKVKDFNVYLRPLIDELKNLWEHGARVTDMSIANIVERSYVARAVLMWTMHDYPGYGIASSLQTQGYYACPPCGPEEVPSYGTVHLGKTIYHGHRKFLARGHKWRHQRHKKKFNGQMETSLGPPERWTGWQWLAQWGKVEEGTLSMETSGMKGCSIFYELEYWAVRN